MPLWCIQVICMCGVTFGFDRVDVQFPHVRGELSTFPKSRPETILPIWCDGVPAGRSAARGALLAQPARPRPGAVMRGASGVAASTERAPLATWLQGPLMRAGNGWREKRGACPAVALLLCPPCDPRRPMDRLAPATQPGPCQRNREGSWFTWFLAARDSGTCTYSARGRSTLGAWRAWV